MQSFVSPAALEASIATQLRRPKQILNNLTLYPCKELRNMSCCFAGIPLFHLILCFRSCYVHFGLSNLKCVETLRSLQNEKVINPRNQSINSNYPAHGTHGLAKCPYVIVRFVVVVTLPNEHVKLGKKMQTWHHVGFSYTV